jgi:uncharacterized membrane protein
MLGWIIGAVVLIALAVFLVYIAIQGIIRFRQTPSAA